MSDSILRRPSAAPNDGIERAEGAVREFLAFDVADESYALPLASIREILKPPPITPVPRAQHDVLGIISVRGRITTVVDLRKRLQMTVTEPDRHARVLLVDSGDEVLGLLVDRVMQVHRLVDEEIELTAVVSGDMSEFFMGIGRPRLSTRGRARAEADDGDHDDEDILILLDAAALLRNG